jgi:ABC-type transport system involved in multi-copper enzyme maturation permease subunit
MENTIQPQPCRLSVGEPNPVLVKELRGRMRGARAFIMLTMYLLLLGCFMLSVYSAYADDLTGADMTELGRTTFLVITLIEILMATFIAPAFTAGAISGERERQTYELLRTTLLPARKLVYGKLLSALTYMFLLIMVAVPLESLAFIWGGVMVEEMVVALVLLLVTAISFAAIGLFFSSIVRSTHSSTVLSYIAVLLLAVVLPILLSILLAPGIDNGMSWTAYLMFLALSISPITAAVITEGLIEENILYFWWDSLFYNPHTTTHVPVPLPWIIYTLFWLAITAILLSVTISRVRAQEK